MANNILDRFNKQIVGSDNTIADYTSKISPTGDFTRIKDITVILNSWNTILSMPTRSYTFDPSRGSDLYKMVFEPADEETIEQIKNEINYRIMSQDDRALITDINVTFFSNKKGFNVEVYCDYDGETGSLSADITEGILNFLED